MMAMTTSIAAVARMSSGTGRPFVCDPPEVPASSPRNLPAKPESLASRLYGYTICAVATKPCSSTLACPYTW